MRASPLAVPYLWLYENVASPFINPSRDKLLPDWTSIPNIHPDTPCPPTLVLDLEDTLVHATWDPKFGWRYAKRPGTEASGTHRTGTTQLRRALPAWCGKAWLLLR